MELSWGKCTIKIGKLQSSGEAPSSWIDIPTPVENSTKLTPTKGAKKEAKIEGGENEAVKYAANVSVSAILSCRPFFILIFLPYIKMNHYGFSRKSIWKNLETFP